MLFLASLCLSLTACGFEPIYGTKFQNAQTKNIASDLASVEIANIPNYEGQYLRNALIDRFYPKSRPNNDNIKYILNISPIKEKVTDLDITKGASYTRAQLKLSTKLTLIDQKSGKELLTRKLNSTSSYNILTSEFATRVSAKNMKENTLDDLARQIELQIGLYLQK